MANAARVQAASARPDSGKTSCVIRLLCWAKNGSYHQENIRLNSAALTVRLTASSTSLAVTQRSLPAPWVQANRNVPVSNSRASSGPPAKTPINIGMTRKTAGSRPTQTLYSWWNS